MTPYALASIVTKFHGPTNYRGARVSARRGDARPGDRKVTVAWDDALDTFENHLTAAQHLAHQMDWVGDWIGGSTDDGYAFVRFTTLDNVAFSVRR